MMTVDNTAELTDAERLVAEAAVEDFPALLRIAGLDPGRDLRFANWSGVDFSGADLRGYDFTGARLEGCRFADALVEGARFDMATVERATLRRARDWDAHVRSWRPSDRRPSGRHLRDLAVFSDAPFAPEMVVIPAGTFLMGGTTEEHQRYRVSDVPAATELPRHPVAIAQRFALARTPLTFADYDLFCRDTEKKARPDDQGWGRGGRPVINIDWEDAVAWCTWMSERTGAFYRLPSEAEWEYAARAGAATAHPWGNEWNPSMANGRDGGHDRTSEAGAYPPNGFGLVDMIGNVWEWCADGWEKDYRLPRRQRPHLPSGVAHRVVRGGSWGIDPGNLRSANRFRLEPVDRYNNLGFRPARTLTP